MTVSLAFEPLAKVELAFLEQRRQYYRKSDNSISVSAYSKLPLPYETLYTIRIAEPTRGFVYATVGFGLPLQPEDLKGLSLFLNRSIQSVVFDWYGGSQILTASRWVDEHALFDELSQIYTFCDFLYPLIMHIRRERSWNEDLVRLALLSQRQLLNV